MRVPIRPSRINLTIFHTVRQQVDGTEKLNVSWNNLVTCKCFTTQKLRGNFQSLIIRVKFSLNIRSTKFFSQKFGSYLDSTLLSLFPSPCSSTVIFNPTEKCRMKMIPTGNSRMATERWTQSRSSSPSKLEMVVCAKSISVPWILPGSEKKIITIKN